MADAQIQKKSKNPPRQAVQKKPTKAVTYHQLALRFFAQGNYSKSIQFAAAFLRQNPAHKPSLILMARSYYRLGNQARAVKLFGSVDIDALTVEEVVEYQLAAFAARAYRLSAVLHQKIPEKHSYKDISRFYSGVSYLYIKNYSRASQLLRQARRLPKALVADRRRLLEDIDELKNRGRRGFYAQERSYAIPIEPTTIPIAPPASSGAGSPLPSESVAPAASVTAAPKAGWSTSFTPIFSYEVKSEKIDFNGYDLVQGTSRSSVAQIPSSIKYSASPRSFGAQPTFTLNLTPSYDDIEYNKDTSQLIASADRPEAVQNQVTSTSGHDYSADLRANFEILYPVSDPIDLVASYQENHEYVDASQKKDYVVRGPSLKIIGNTGSFKGNASFTMLSTENAGKKTDDKTTIAGSVTYSGDPMLFRVDVSSLTVNAVSKTGLQSSMTGTVSIERPVWDLTLSLDANIYSRSPYEGSVLSGPTRGKSEQEAVVSLEWPLSFGLNLTGSFGYSMFSDMEYAVKAGEEQTIFPLSGDTMSYSLLVSAPIFGTYGGVDMALRMSDRKLNIAEDIAPETQVAMLKSLWSQSTTSSVKVTLKYPF